MSESCSTLDRKAGSDTVDLSDLTVWVYSTVLKFAAILLSKRKTLPLKYPITNNLQNELYRIKGNMFIHLNSLPPPSAGFFFLLWPPRVSTVIPVVPLLSGVSDQKKQWLFLCLLRSGRLAFIVP